MFKLAKKWWKYLTAKLTGKFEESADPKVQLEQALMEAQEQHKRLVEQAANVIANQKQTEMRLDAKMAEFEKLNANARQAVLMADEASKAGDTKKASEYTSSAEAFANRLIAVEEEVNSLKDMSLQTAQAATQAKAAVQQNSTLLQKKLAEKQKLLSQLDQANMQEAMNKTMDSLNATIGEDVPTLEQVKAKIEERYAKAQGHAELAGESVEGRMLEVEQARMSNEAQARLEQIKSQLGIATAPAQSPTQETASQGETTS